MGESWLPGRLASRAQLKGCGVQAECRSMAFVWLVDHGDHGDLGVISMHNSAEMASLWIEGRFAEPFRVQWEPLDLSPAGDEAVLVGHFEAVPGYATTHSACFMMQRWPVE